MTDPHGSQEQIYRKYLGTLFGLNGKIALVTGGATGIGLTLAKALYRAGAQVAICGRGRHGDLDAACDAIASTGATANADRRAPVAFRCDVTDEAAVDEMFETILEQFERLDILVNNAGTTWGAPSTEMPLERWRMVLDTNLTGSFLCSRAAGRMMVDAGGGSIIMIGSVAGFIGGELGIAGYAASKAGVTQLARQLAVEWAVDEVRVNTIAPGWFPTHMSRHFTVEEGPMRDYILRQIPMGRFGDTDELAGAVLFLASDASSYMTGQLIVVDGGILAH